MTRPNYLKKGDTVAIVCPARKASSKDLYYAKNLLHSWGLQVVFGDTVDSVSNQFGGTDRQRARDLQSFLENENVEAIWCARGGYGSIRIIDQLDFSTFVKNPKWIIGYSDITVLLSHLANIGIESIHAAMPYQIDQCTTQAIESLRKSLFGEPASIRWKSNYPKDFTTSGRLVGGNLSILQSLIGSSSSLHTEGNILFIEETDEYLYHLDRMMFSLSRSECLSKLCGLIVGGMTKMRDHDIPFGYSSKEIIYSHTKNYDYPVIFDAPIGHLTNNQALHIGRHSILSYQSGYATIHQP